MTALSSEEIYKALLKEIEDSIVAKSYATYASRCLYEQGVPLKIIVDEVLAPLKEIEMATKKHPRTISDIKKDIKHEKNPMRLKQLNKELNKLYKENKRKKKREEKDAD